MSNGFSVDLDVENIFPNLKSCHHAKTSESTLFEMVKYNCIAHAAGDNKRWWEPKQTGADYYWPDKAPHEYTPEAYKMAFILEGFEDCDNQEVEEGFEKVALYWGKGGPHAAKQLPNGRWSSKLGDNQDIEHETLEGLETDGLKPAYGTVYCTLKRHIGNKNDHG